MIVKFSKITFLFLFFLLTSQSLLANSFGKSLNVNGLGITLDYGNGLGKEAANDMGAYLSYRNGFFYLVSGFITADAGWRFDQKSLNTKLGIQGMILFLGFEAGFVSKYEQNKRENKYSPGIYLGLAGFFPSDDLFLPFFSLGTNIYFKNKETEFYASFTFFFNLWK